MRNDVRHDGQPLDLVCLAGVVRTHRQVRPLQVLDQRDTRCLVLDEYKIHFFTAREVPPAFFLGVSAIRYFVLLNDLRT